jgi:hypothetical protein
MNVTANDAILLAHATFGVLGTVLALWVFVEALNASEQNAARIRSVALGVTLCMGAACLFGGYWYLHFYPAERALILAGPWPLAHSVFMETKEHLFLMTFILALYLPIAAADKLVANAAARRMVLSVAMLIVVTGLALEGSGAIIDHGVKVALLRPAAKIPAASGTQK